MLPDLFIKKDEISGPTILWQCYKCKNEIRTKVGDLVHTATMIGIKCVCGSFYRTLEKT